MPAAVPFKGAVCTARYKLTVQSADIIPHHSHDSVFRVFFLVAKAQINVLRLYRALLFKLHPVRKPHRGRGGGDTVEQICLLAISEKLESAYLFGKASLVLLV